MSINKYRDHLLILPEDDANRQLANGFVLETCGRKVQVLPEVGGWRVVIERFLADHVREMERHERRRMVLLLDFDDAPEREAEILARIPEHLRSRVFLLGTRTEPEGLKRAGLGSYEGVGRTLADECRRGQRQIWNHELLLRNLGELDRLGQEVCRFLFEE